MAIWHHRLSAAAYQYKRNHQCMALKAAAAASHRKRLNIMKAAHRRK